MNPIASPTGRLRTVLLILALAWSAAMAQTEPPADIQPPAAAGQIDDSAAGAVADGDTTPADAPDDARSDEEIGRAHV